MERPGSSGMEYRRPRPPGGCLPLGLSHLAWSFNRDGEADERMLADRDHRFGLDSQRKVGARAVLCALARPQRGVDLLGSSFPSARGRPAAVHGRG